MTIESDIITTLDGYANLTALVSTRNYTRTLPQNPTYPNTVSTVVNTTPGNLVNGRDALTNYLVQIDVRASSVSSLSAVSRQVIAAMEAAAVFSAYWENMSDMPYIDGVDTHRRILDFSIWYQLT